MNYTYLSSWVVFQLSIFTLGFFLQKNNIDLTLLNQLNLSVFISRGAGLCLAITPAMMILPMCRHTMTLLRNYIPLLNKVFPDFSVYFHKLCAYTILFWSLVHMTGHYFNFYGVENIIKINSMFNLHYTIYASVSGHLMMMSMFLIFSFSGIYFRKYYFEAFWYSHHAFIIFFIVYPLHGIGCFVKTNTGKCLPYFSGFIFAPVLFVYIIERLVRELRPLSLIRNVSYHSGDIFKIQFDKKINYKPGQYILLKCDAVSSNEWHPFTISSSPLDPYLEVTIRCLGDWTYKFREYLINNKQNLPFIQYDGNFGSPIDTITNYDSVILVASGIGITPYISMIKYIIQSQKSDVVKKIDLIWINRDKDYFDWFNDELKYFDENIVNTINFHMYLTEEFDENRIKLIIDQKHLSYVTNTNIPIHYGRPDFMKIFNRYLSVNNNMKVGCFVCSSKPVEKIVRDTCSKFSNKNVSFVFKAESFS